MKVREPVFKRNVIFVIGIILLLIFLYRIENVLLIFFAAFVIASALNPVISLLNRKMPKEIAILLVYALSFLILAIVFIPLVDILINQTIQFIQLIPSYWARVNRLLSMLVFDTNVRILPDYTQILTLVDTYNRIIINRSINITMNFFNGLGLLFTIAIIVYYMLLDVPVVTRTYLAFFPESKRVKVNEITQVISKGVGRYVGGQLLAILITGFLTTIGLFIAGVNFSLLLGILTGILDIFPIIGPLIALFFVILVALAEKPILALWALLVFAIVQWIGNTFIRSSIFSKILHLHPLVLIFTLLVAARLFGIIGIILAPAFAVAIRVLIQQLYLDTSILQDERKDGGKL